MRLRAAAFVLLCGLTPVAAQADIESTGTNVAIALPLIAGGIAVYKDDWGGAAQLGLGTAATLGTALVLKKLVKAQRPDGSGEESFPSDTAALAFAPAQFLWDRYGWTYGVPAYLAAGFVGYSRVEAKKHRWSEVAASAGIAMLSSQIFTTRYRGLRYGVSASRDGAYASVNYRF